MIGQVQELLAHLKSMTMLMMVKGVGKHGYCHLEQSLFDIYAHHPNILSQCGDLVYKLLGAHLDNCVESKFRKTSLGVPGMFVPVLCDGKFKQQGYVYQEISL